MQQFWFGVVSTLAAEFVVMLIMAAHSVRVVRVKPKDVQRAKQVTDQESDEE